MSISLRTKLRSLSTLHLFRRNIRSFSSSDDALGRSAFPPEPIPNRPLRNHSRFPNSSAPRENENLNSLKAETDADFLERFKLGFDRKLENPSTDSGGKRLQPEEKGFKAETDADFLERFKLGFDRKLENPSTDSGGKRLQPEKKEIAEPLSPPEDAEEIFKKMKETGLIPNAVAMLDGLCKDGLVQEAMKLFGLMREKGTIPEVVVYTAVVDGFCKAHKLEDAVRIFKKMQSNGIVPNAFSYQVLVRGLCNGNRLDDAYGFTIEMLEAGHSPNLATFTGLVDVYCREKGLEEAQNVIKAMRQKGYFFEEKAVREYLDKKGPFLPLVWEAILGKKASKRSLF